MKFSRCGTAIGSMSQIQLSQFIMVLRTANRGRANPRQLSLMQEAGRCVIHWAEWKSWPWHHQYLSYAEQAVRNFIETRLSDSSVGVLGRLIALPGDGELVFPNGNGMRMEHWIKRTAGSYELLVEYHPGLEDRKFVAECDGRYLNTLLWGPKSQILPEVFPDTTKLRETEPGVWLLWLRAQCPPDIGSWYMTQLKLSNIKEIVEAAEMECQDWSSEEQAQYERPAREVQLHEASFSELRAQLATLVTASRSVLQPLEAKLSLLPATEFSGLREFMSYLGSLRPQSLYEEGLTKAIRELERWQPYLSSLTTRIAILVAEQGNRSRVASRVARLCAKLQLLLRQALEILDPIEARNEIQVLPAAEQTLLKDLISHLRSLKPDTLDEGSLNSEISFIEAKQEYLAAIQETIAPLAVKHAKVLAKLRSKLQELVTATNKIILPIDERNEAILLPQDESRALQDLIAHIKTLTPDTLDEVSLNSDIALLESKQKYLKLVQKRLVVLAKARAAKVTALQKAIYNFNLTIKAAELAGDFKEVIKNCVFIQDHYGQIAALGIDCSRELAAINQKIKATQSKLNITPSSTVIAAPSQEQLRCRVIPHAELQLDQELGSGAFGVVYRGLWHTDTVAVKQLHTAQLTIAAKQAFISEVEIMTKLDSERLVRLFGACVAPDPYCIVMEYMPRGSLYSLLHGTEQYSWKISLQIATDIGNGLAFLHREKVIHRDLKSLNVLLDAQYRAKICDFGLAKVRQEVSVTSTRPVTAVGTNTWNAPELFGLRPKYSFASDIYAYGIILWEILTREIPYKDVLDPNQIQIAVKAGEREEIPATCSTTYRETIERCWAQVPEQRPQALQVVQALQTEFATTAKSWHIAPELKPNGRNLEGYYLIPADDYDMRKVVAAYEHCPVPGMEVGRVTIIFNPVLNKSFADGIELLEGRFGNPAFAAKWSSDGDATTVAWRREVIRRFEAMAHPYQDAANQHVKILPVWHGTKAAIVNSIARTGYANLATTDPGFFGKGLYGSYEAEYAYRVYGPGQYGAQAALLVNWIACFSAYPVVGYKVPGYTGIVEDPGDMLRLQEKGNFGNYDAHFVPVRPRTSDPNEGSYYPCRPKERATYHEVVVFETARILPRYIVELQPSLVAPPSVAPLLAATGMFGHQQESKARAPIPAPKP